MQKLRKYPVDGQRVFDRNSGAIGRIALDGTTFFYVYFGESTIYGYMSYNSKFFGIYMEEDSLYGTAMASMDLFEIGGLSPHKLGRFYG